MHATVDTLTLRRLWVAAEIYRMFDRSPAPTTLDQQCDHLVANWSVLTALQAPWLDAVRIKPNCA